MGPFASDKTELRRRAAEVLAELREAEGLAAVDGVYAETVWHDRMQRFIAGRGLSGDGEAITRAPTRLTGWPRVAIERGLRGLDHTSLWRTVNTRRPVLVTQPYSIDGARVRDLLAFADQHGLRLTVSAEASWHNPAHTLFVALCTPRKEGQQ